MFGSMTCLTILLLSLILFHSCGSLRNQSYDSNIPTHLPTYHEMLDHQQYGRIRTAALTRRPTAAPTAPPNIPTIEYYAIYDLYNATNGPGWTWRNLSDGRQPWSFTADPAMSRPCQDNWEGILCKCSGIDCYIISLTLRNHNLSGTIPATISNLTQLTVLNLGMNNLTNSVPSSLWSMTSLMILSLGYNSLNGELPDTIGRMKLLTVLELAQNYFYGRIPLSFYDLIKLQTVELSTNYFQGSLSNQIDQLTFLTTFRVHVNTFTGTIPITLTNLTHLEILDLSNNTFHGSIPNLNDPKKLYALQVLELGENHLQGTLPDLSSCLYLNRFVINRNTYFYGSIPDSYSKLQYMQWFAAKLNVLTGTLPLWIGTNWLHLRLLTDNMFYGSVTHLANCKNITSIDLDMNSFVGSIENVFTNEYITYFRLSHNQFTGKLPVQQYWRELTYYLMSNNYFIGSISDYFHSSNLLHDFDVGHNYVTGLFPNWMSNIKGLTYFHIEYNFLEGILYDSFTRSYVLGEFYINNNYFTGTLPITLGVLPRLVALDCGNNAFTGTLPSNYLSMDVLQIFFVLNNMLTGSIVLPYNNASNGLLAPALVNFDISNNQFTGSLPFALFSIETIETFAAASNCFIGELSDSICTAVWLTDLNLDGLSTASTCRQSIFTTGSLTNYFNAFVVPTQHATIPSCLFTMIHLNTLHLSGNNFQGTLPDNVNISSSLFEISLSHNLLTGTIPYSIQQRSWEILDLSYNKLSGKLITYFALLDDNMYTNNMTMTTNNTNNNSSSTIYLNVNRLSGKIPTSLYALPMISMLEGNLFSCDLFHTQLPLHDPGRFTYDCASDSVDRSIYLSLFTYTIPLLCAIVYLGYQIYIYRMYYLHKEEEGGNGNGNGNRVPAGHSNDSVAVRRSSMHLHLTTTMNNSNSNGIVESRNSSQSSSNSSRGGRGGWWWLSWRRNQTHDPSPFRHNNNHSIDSSNMISPDHTTTITNTTNNSGLQDNNNLQSNSFFSPRPSLTTNTNTTATPQQQFLISPTYFFKPMLSPQLPPSSPLYLSPSTSQEGENHLPITTTISANNMLRDSNNAESFSSLPSSTRSTIWLTNPMDHQLPLPTGYIGQLIMFCNTLVLWYTSLSAHYTIVSNDPLTALEEHNEENKITTRTLLITHHNDYYHSIYFVMNFFQVIRSSLLYVTMFIIGVLMPIYIILSYSGGSTYEYKYAWTIGSVYLSGTTSTIVLFVAFTMLILVVYYLYYHFLVSLLREWHIKYDKSQQRKKTKQQKEKEKEKQRRQEAAAKHNSKQLHHSLSRNTETKATAVAEETIESDEQQQQKQQQQHNKKHKKSSSFWTLSWPNTFAWMVVMLINMVIMIIVNAMYVVTVVYPQPYILIMTQIALALFKVTWNEYLLWKLIPWMKYIFLQIWYSSFAWYWFDWKIARYHECCNCLHYVVTASFTRGNNNTNKQEKEKSGEVELDRMNSNASINNNNNNNNSNNNSNIIEVCSEAAIIKFANDEHVIQNKETKHEEESKIEDDITKSPPITPPLTTNATIRPHFTSIDWKIFYRIDLTFLIIAILFNNILAPYISIAVISPDCFYNAFFAPREVSATYSYCSDYSIQGVDFSCDAYLSESSTYDPPFSYRYQCSSVLPVTYASVYIYMFILVGVIKPIGLLLLKYINDHVLSEDSTGYQWLQSILPENVKKLRPLPTTADTTATNPLPTTSNDTTTPNTSQDSLPHNNHTHTHALIIASYHHPLPELFSKYRVIVRLITYYAILISFGAIFPPLALIACLGTWSMLAYEQMMIGRILCEAKALNYPWYEEKLHIDCFGIAQLFLPNPLLLTSFACLLFAYLIFDTCGDSQGYSQALIPTAFMICMPFLIYFVVLMEKRCQITRKIQSCWLLLVWGKKKKKEEEGKKATSFSSEGEDEGEVDMHQQPASDNTNSINAIEQEVQDDDEEEEEEEEEMEMTSNPMLSSTIVPPSSQQLAEYRHSIDVDMRNHRLQSNHNRVNSSSNSSSSGTTNPHHIL